MVLLQIPAAIYKYLRYDVVEGIIIGTFSTQAGALSTIFPLFIIGYIVAFYFCYKKNNWYLLLIPCLMFFAWGGGKRGFFMFLPVLLFSAFIIYNLSIRQYKMKAQRLILSLFIIAIFSGITIYLGARLNPVFNPERERWGSFNLSYMINQAIVTQTEDSQRFGGTTGRISTFNAALDHIFYSNNTTRILLGDGPDRLDSSNNYAARYGIVYGITGATFYLISSGAVGAVSFFLLFVFFGFRSYRYLKIFDDPFYLAISFGSTLAIILFFIDYFFYSTSFFIGYIPSLLFYYLFALIVRYDLNIGSRIG
jgi:hypothetical protein